HSPAIEAGSGPSRRNARMLEDGRRKLLLTVSNRGPVEHRLSEKGCVEAAPGQGGLATALRVAAQIEPSIWLSSPLTATDRQIAEGYITPPMSSCRAHYVPSDPSAYKLFY